MGAQLGTGPINQPEEDESAAKQLASINPEKAKKDAEKRLEEVGDPNAKKHAEIVAVAAARKQLDTLETKLYAAHGELDKHKEAAGLNDQDQGSGAWSSCLRNPRNVFLVAKPSSSWLTAPRNPGGPSPNSQIFGHPFTG